MPVIDSPYLDVTKTALINRAFMSTKVHDNVPMGASHAGFMTANTRANESEIRDSMAWNQPSSRRAEIQTAVIKPTQNLGGVNPVNAAVPMMEYKWKN